MLTIDHFPQAHPKFWPEALARLSPKNRAKAEAHIERMKQEVKKWHDKIARINAMADAGLCYCDDEYLCKRHSDAVHAEIDRMRRERLRWPGVETIIAAARSQA